MRVQSMQNYWLFFLLNMQMFGFLVTVVIPNKKWKQKSNDRKVVTVEHMFFVSSDASAALGVDAA